jgi:hypothetical protein
MHRAPCARACPLAALSACESTELKDASAQKDKKADKKIGKIRKVEGAAARGVERSAAELNCVTRDPLIGTVRRKRTTFGRPASAKRVIPGHDGPDSSGQARDLAHDRDDSRGETCDSRREGDDCGGETGDAERDRHDSGDKGGGVEQDAQDSGGKDPRCVPLQNSSTKWAASDIRCPQRKAPYNRPFDDIEFRVMPVRCDAFVRPSAEVVESPRRQ